MTITTVKKQPSGFWVITDAAGTRYATKSNFQAALADRYRELGTEVRIDSASGWYYRDLREIAPVAKQDVA